MLYFVLLFTLILACTFDAAKLSAKNLRGGGDIGIVVSYKSFVLVLYFFLAFSLFFISGMRGELGTDWVTYKKIFDYIKGGRDINLAYNGVEKGYVLMNKFFSLFTKNYFVMQFYLSLFTCSVIFYNIWKNCSYPFFQLFIYFVTQYFGIQFEIVRQGLAIAIIILGVKYIRERNFFFWFLMIILAMQFHISAIVALPLYFTTYKKISKRFALFLLIASFVLRVFGDTFLRIIFGALALLPFLPQRITHLLLMYLSVSNKHGSQTEFNSGIGLIVIYIIYSFIVFLCYLNKENKSKEFFLSNFLLALIIEGVGRNIGIIGRCALYYTICGNGLFAYNLLIEKNRFYKKLDFVRIMIVTLFIIFHCMTFTKGFNKERPSGKTNAEYYIPYKMFVD